MKSLVQYLSEAKRYQIQISKLHLKHAQSRRLFSIEQDEVALASVIRDEKRFAKLMAKTVAQGEYELKPARLRTIVVNGKERELFHFRLSDYLLHGVIADLILELMLPNFSPCLYSYLKGRDWWKAVQNFSHYVRDYRQKVKDPKKRGIYVLRCDIKSYTDTIPVGNSSPVWEQLKELFKFYPSSKNELKIWGLIQQVLRPEVYIKKGQCFTKLEGVPTGSPISTTLFNFYLHPLDKMLDQISGAFYARYSDDLLFAHPEHKIVEQAKEQINTMLKQLFLTTNPDKEKELFFNGAGRPCPLKRAKAAVVVDFLGCSVYFNATVALKPEKLRVILEELRQRILRTVQSIKDDNKEKAGKIICHMINETLDPNSSRSQKYADFLRSIITNREQLKQIDYLLAVLVLEGLTGSQSPRGFRQYSYQKMRKKWGLISLCHARNRFGRRLNDYEEVESMV
ncbi:MAG: hypothetical protein K1X66_07785 [Verrucomicrobiae bacterium]|nr:hypothetical protein [Verrucomicrobiae bacterium]